MVIRQNQQNIRRRSRKIESEKMEDNGKKKNKGASRGVINGRRITRLS